TSHCWVAGQSDHVTPGPNAGPVSQCRTFGFRIYPTTRQAQTLERTLSVQCELFNAALEERRGAWRWERRSVSYFDQCRTLTELREIRPEVLDFGVTMSRGTLRRLDRAFCAFYRRCERGETPGFPRFKARVRFDSLQWEDTCGWRVKAASRWLSLMGIGDVKLHLHRAVRGLPRALSVKREGRRWFVSIRCRAHTAATDGPGGRARPRRGARSSGASSSPSDRPQRRCPPSYSKRRGTRSPPRAASIATCRMTPLHDGGARSLM